MKLLNTSEVDLNGIAVKLRGEIVGKIFDWSPSNKTYEEVYEIKYDDYKKYLPVKSKWTLTVVK